MIISFLFLSEQSNEKNPPQDYSSQKKQMKGQLVELKVSTALLHYRIANQSCFQEAAWACLLGVIIVLASYGVPLSSTLPVICANIIAV